MSVATVSHGRRLARGWSRATTPAGFRMLAIAVFTLLWAVIPSGAAVRLTASGLGCPDWPHCDGGVIPAADANAWIEFTNRLFSGAVIVVIVFAWLAARRLPGRPRGLRWLALVAAATTLGQIPLGAVTVELDLHPLLVASHFLLSIIALTAGGLLALRAHDHARGVDRRLDRRVGIVAGLGLLTLGGVLVTGTLVTASGPHSGDRGAVDRIWALDEAVYVHFRVALAFVCVAVLLAAWCWRRHAGGRRVDPLVQRLGLAIVPLIGTQIALGEIQWRTELPWGVILAHVAIAGLLWSSALVVAWRLAWPQRGYAPRAAFDWQGTQRSASGSASSRRSGMASPQSTHSP